MFPLLPSGRCKMQCNDACLACFSDIPPPTSKSTKATLKRAQEKDEIKRNSTLAPSPPDFEFCGVGRGGGKVRWVEYKSPRNTALTFFYWIPIILLHITWLHDLKAFSKQERRRPPRRGKAQQTGGLGESPGLAELCRRVWKGGGGRPARQIE